MEKGRKTALVTGASRGIGHAAAKLFVERGWRVITCARGEVEEGLRLNENWSRHLPANLADAASVDNFVAAALHELDGEPLHALVNNAGMSPKSPNQERLGCLNGDVDAWHDVYELNVFATLY